MPASEAPHDSDDPRLSAAIAYTQRAERRKAEADIRDAWHDGLAEGKDEGFADGYKLGYRKGWIEAGGDHALAETHGLRPDDRAWARGVLHLAPDASAQDAQQAYRQLSKAFHPDRQPDLGDALFKTLSEARRILGF